MAHKKFVMLMATHEKISFNLRYIFAIEIEEIYIVTSIKKENTKPPKTVQQRKTNYTVYGSVSNIMQAMVRSTCNMISQNVEVNL